METLVILVVLGSAMLHAVWNAIIKGGADKLVETSMKAAGGGIAVLGILPFLPPLPPGCLPYLAATVSIHFFIIFLSPALIGERIFPTPTPSCGAPPRFSRR